MNDDIMNNDMILKDYEVDSNSCIYIINGDCILVEIKVKSVAGKIEILKYCQFISDFKVSKAKQNKEI